MEFLFYKTPIYIIVFNFLNIFFTKAILYIYKNVNKEIDKGISNFYLYICKTIKKESYSLCNNDFVLVIKIA